MTGARDRNASRATFSTSPRSVAIWRACASPRSFSARSRAGTRSATPALASAMTRSRLNPWDPLMALDARVGDHAAEHGRSRFARKRGHIGIRDLLHLSKEVHELLAVPHEVPGRHVDLGKHVLEWLALRPLEHGDREPRVELPAELHLLLVFRPPDLFP